MSSRLQTASLSVSDLLSGSATFTIPNFQRKYSWREEDASKLLEDLLEASGAIDPADAQPDYFLGPILLLMSKPYDQEKSKGANGSEGNFLNGGEKGIIDGQQRLLTLTVLAAVLRDLDVENDGEVANLMRDFLWASQQRRKASRLFKRLRADDEAARQPRIHFADRLEQFMQTFLLKEGACGEPLDADIEFAIDEQALIDVRKHFWQELKELRQDQRATLAHFLCDRCHLLVAATQDEGRAHIIFQRMNERVRPLESHDLLKADVIARSGTSDTQLIASRWESVQELLGSDFNALFSHLRAIHNVKSGNQLNAVRAIINKVGGADQFVDAHLQPFAETFYNIRLGSANEGPYARELRSYLVSLGRLGGDDWVPGAMLALRPGAYAQEAALQILREIERYAYLTRLHMLANGRRKTRFSAITRAIQDGSVLENLDDVFPLSKEEVRTIFFNLKELYVRSSRTCKALLMRLNDHFSEEPLTSDAGGYSVEHIMPRRTKATAQWREWVPNTEERASLTHSLGNLILVTQKENQKLGNKDFGEKKAILTASQDHGALLPLTQDILQYEVWDGDVIRAREARFMQALYDMWRIAPKG